MPCVFARLGTCCLAALTASIRCCMCRCICMHVCPCRAFTVIEGIALDVDPDYSTCLRMYACVCCRAFSVIEGIALEVDPDYSTCLRMYACVCCRAFSVIEGIALEVDPDYAIVAECFPYLSRRLLADDSPRARALLRELLYGNKQRLDVDRLLRLAEGFAAYNTDGLVEETEVRGLQACVFHVLVYICVCVVHVCGEA